MFRRRGSAGHRAAAHGQGGETMFITRHVTMSRFVKSHVCHVLGCQVRETIARAAALGVFSQMEGLEEYPLAELTIGLGKHSTVQYSKVQYSAIYQLSKKNSFSLLFPPHYCICMFVCEEFEILLPNKLSEAYNTVSV